MSKASNRRCRVRKGFDLFQSTKEPFSFFWGSTLTETVIPLTEAARGQLHFVVSTILRRKAGTQRPHLQQNQVTVVVVVFVVVKEVGILIDGGLLHPRTTVQNFDAIQDIQDIDAVVRVHVHILDLDAIVSLPLYLNELDLRESLKLASIHVHRA